MNTKLVASLASWFVTGALLTLLQAASGVTWEQIAVDPINWGLRLGVSCVVAGATYTLARWQPQK